MITVLKRGKTNEYIRRCPKCDTLFSYMEVDEEPIKPPAIGYTIECPICKDKYVTRNYYKNSEIAFDHRKKFGDE